MGIVLRLAFAVLAIIVGNLLVPDGTVSGVATATDQSNDFKPFIGTALIVVGAVIFARTSVTAFKNRFLSDQ